MARIRTYKPTFWTDEDLTECSVSARLLFLGLMTFADDNGNLKRSAKTIKMQVFPADTFDCEPLIQELITHGRLREYSVSGCKYLNIKGFRKHQVINRPSHSDIPGMEKRDDSPKTHGVLTEPSVTETETETETEKKTPLAHPPGEPAGKTPSTPPSVPELALEPKEPQQTVAKLPAEFLEAWQAYPKRMGGNSRADAFKAWQARVRSGVKPGDMLAGVKRYADFCEATGKVNTDKVMQAQRFFGPGENWTQDWATSPASSDSERWFIPGKFRTQADWERSEAKRGVA